MSIFIADCPRCRAKHTTFDVLNWIQVGIQHQWQPWFEVFCVCRACKMSTTFVLCQKEYGEEIKFKGDRGINDDVRDEGFICIKDIGAVKAPEYLPPNVEKIFNEGAACITIGSWNAAGTMFRSCIDLATRPMLPPEDEANGPNAKQRRDLGLRLPWLFENGRLHEGLRDLSSCVHQDGNDAAHTGTLSKEEALDLLDFTTALLERLFTEPQRLNLAKQRRENRRAPRQ